MLALRPPPLVPHFGMSSDQVPAKDDMFGYTFPSGHIDNAAASENITAAGPPLLNESQFSHLQSFFDQGPFNFDPSIPFPDQELAHGDHPVQDFDFTFQSAPPPTYYGASAIADPSQTSHIFADLGQHGGPSFSIPSAESHVVVSDEEIRAANALMSTTGQDLSFSDNKPHWASLVGLPSPANSYSASLEQRGITATACLDESTSPVMTQQGLSHHAPADSSLGAVFFGMEQNRGVPAGVPRSRHRALPRFGSDSNFSGNGYISTSTSETEQAVLQRLHKDMEILEPIRASDTRPNTQPPSPVLQKRGQPGFQDRRSYVSPTAERKFVLPVRPEPTPVQSDNESSSDGDVSPGANPSKRRKTLNEGDRGRTGSDAASTSAYRTSSFSASRAKKPRKISISELPGAAGGARKKSSASSSAAAAAQSKAQRENLSEEQKRNNHILSEQKRRNLIKQGFEELNELVPGLKTGGFSKSSVLMEGAKFLEILVRGNDILRDALGEA